MRTQSHWRGVNGDVFLLLLCLLDSEGLVTHIHNLGYKYRRVSSRTPQMFLRFKYSPGFVCLQSSVILLLYLSHNVLTLFLYLTWLLAVTLVLEWWNAQLVLGARLEWQHSCVCFTVISSYVHFGVERCGCAAKVPLAVDAIVTFLLCNRMLSHGFGLSRVKQVQVIQNIFT